ncbi:MAG TPA: alpha amylase C-terminal domain-containing protein, partial [Candidatus Binatia bacterium]|nr:alpha amylase C-terminal domain-containing protein [Candidatus Binatia bacterium]
LSFVRQNKTRTSRVLVILNLTPVARCQYRVGLPQGGHWREALNSDSAVYGGSNQGNLGGVTAQEHPIHNQPFSAEFTLPPMSVTVFKAEAQS